MSAPAAPQITWLDDRPKEFVAAVTEPKTLNAGRRQDVELLFRIQDGFHINSHTPKSELLIRTELTLQPTAGITVGRISYPQGHPYTFSFDPREKLDVYTGALTIVAPVQAKHPGSYTLRGELQYQACDNASCYPAQKIPVKLEIVAR